MLFMGLEISNTRQSLDFNTGESSLTVQLFPCNDEQVFEPVPIGTPVYFPLGIGYYGIVDKYTRDNNPDSEYSVYLTNGVNVLEGCQLILNNYFGAVNTVPNLYNLAGYFGYNSDYITKNGLHANGLLAGILDLTSQTGPNDYGQPIKYRGKKYALEFFGLPTLTEYYRVGQDSMGMMDAIREIFELYGLDMTIELKQPSVQQAIDGFSGVFVISAVDRTVPVDLHAIENYVDSQDCIISKNLGYERRSAVHNKFVLGANIEALFFNTPQTQGDNILADGITQAQYANDTILPYFGVDINDNAIVGWTHPHENEYYFDIDVTDINHPEIGRTYRTCLSELRAAKQGRDAWEVFLGERSCNQFIIDDLPTDKTGVSVWNPFKILMSQAELNSLNLANSPEKLANHSWGNYNIYTGFREIYIPKYGFNYLYAKDPQVAYQYYSMVKPIFVNETDTDVVRNGYATYYPSTDIPNPYYGRASLLRVVNSWAVGFARMTEFDLEEKVATYPDIFEPIWQDYQKKVASDHLKYETIVAALGKGSRRESVEQAAEINNSYSVKAAELYSRLRDLAENYYNRKFMVSVPFTVTGNDFDTGELKISNETVESGYFDFSQWETAQSVGLIPSTRNIAKITDQDNKFYPFVKFENAFVLDVTAETILDSRFDLSEISYEDKIVEYNPTKLIGKNVEFLSGTTYASGDELAIADVWVKCTVEKDIQFIDRSTNFSPRAIIELPNVASIPSKMDAYSVKGRKVIYKAVDKLAKKYAFASFDEDTVKRAIATSLDSIGADEPDYAEAEEIAIADLYAIPLKSNINSYGPWYLAASGEEFDGVNTNYIPLEGPIEYLKDDSLAPWNYNGFDGMNEAAALVVTQGVSNQPFDGTGSIEVLGLPEVNTGQRLAPGLPPVSSIDISEGPNGTTTTYNFQIWSDHRNMNPMRQRYIKKLSDHNTQIKNSIRKFSEQAEKAELRLNNTGGTRFVDLKQYGRRDKSNTSYRVISGESYKSGHAVVMQPSYNATSQALTDYGNKAIMSMDGLFAPFSTVPHDILPAMKLVDGSGEPYSRELNPFTSGDPTNLITRGDSPSLDGMVNYEGLFVKSGGQEGDLIARGVGIRFPMIGVGWGRDTDGNPVPAHPDKTGEYHPDFRTNTNLWKAGPVDIRWDENRGVWAAAGGGGGTLTIMFELTEPIYCETCSATGTIVCRPPGVKKVPDEENGEVILYDFAKGNLTGASVDLIGLKGFASYLEYDAYNDPFIDCPGITSGKYWVITSLFRRDTRCVYD
jgi:hypothetical protein